jgi:hypothetical protein
MEKVLLEDGVTAYDPELWWTKQEAAKQFNVAIRTIERWDARGWISPQYYKPPHSARLAVYFKPDLEQAHARSKELPVAARQVPTGPTTTPTTGRQNDRVRQENRGVPALTAPTLPTADRSSLTGLTLIPPWHKLYVSLEEAKQLTSWPEWALKEAVERKRVKRGPGRKWLFRRADLEKL